MAASGPCAPCGLSGGPHGGPPARPPPLPVPRVPRPRAPSCARGLGWRRQLRLRGFRPPPAPLPVRGWWIREAVNTPLSTERIRLAKW